MNFVEQVQNYNFASNSSSFVDIGLGFCVLLSLVYYGDESLRLGRRLPPS